MKQAHDLKNALLFLETFPIMIKQIIDDGNTDQKELNELLEIYQQKLEIVKKAIRE